MSNRIKLESKRLSSGKYQIKFFILNESSRERYGYMLVEPSETLREVVQKINHYVMRSDDFGYLKLMKSNINKEVLLF